MDLPSIATSDQLFKKPLVASFHDDYRTSNVEGSPGPPWATWRGFTALKCPMDMWVYQEIITKFEIEIIIEGGTAGGGSALFMADVCEALNRGHVISVDIDKNPDVPRHDRITYVQGDTLERSTLDKVLRAIEDEALDSFSTATQLNPDRAKKMLILDDGHSHEHVYKELLLWAPLLNKDDFLVVEDTNLGGPYWGLQGFMLTQDNDSWERQEWCEKFLMTHNPWGYWRKK